MRIAAGIILTGIAALVYCCIYAGAKDEHLMEELNQRAKKKNSEE